MINARAVVQAVWILWVLVDLWVVREARASQAPRKQCEQACAGQIADCVRAIGVFGDFGRVCRKRIVARCRRTGLETCNGGAGTTTTTLPPPCGLLSSGQTTCWSATGASVPCAGTGQDGEVLAGAPLAYRDDGDGTITDLNTGLVWEKLSDDGGIHDQDVQYTWAAAFSEKIVALNTPPCFAGACDWRVPNVRELASIMDHGRAGPGLSPVFDAGCVPGCSVVDCSCPGGLYFWSSTSSIFGRQRAWLVGFQLPSAGGVGDLGKTAAQTVRAVRGTP